MTVEDCIIIGGSQLRWYLPSVAPRTSTVWYGVIFLSETRRQLVHRHNLPPAQSLKKKSHFLINVKLQFSIKVVGTNNLKRRRRECLLTKMFREEKKTKRKVR